MKNKLFIAPMMDWADLIENIADLQALENKR
jgi:hypothetical protein